MTFGKCACILLIICLIAATVSAGVTRPEPTRGTFGAKVGLMSRAHVGGDLDLQTEVGSTAQVYADFPMWGRLFGTAAFDFYYIELVRNNNVMIDASLGLKYELKLTHANMMLRPGVAIGYGFLPEINAIRASNYATIKVFLEAHFPVAIKRTVVCEVGLFGAPTGGNATYDLTLGPAYCLRVGLAFR